MRVAVVVGQVVSTVKHPGLASVSLLVVRDCDPAEPDLGATTGAPAVAVDLVGAGIGEYVLLAEGGAARIPEATAQAPTDLAVVGIVDSVTHDGKVTYDKA